MTARAARRASPSGARRLGVVAAVATATAVVAGLLLARPARATAIPLERAGAGAPVHVGDVVSYTADVPLEPGEHLEVEPAAVNASADLDVRDVRVESAGGGRLARVTVDVQPFAPGEVTGTEVAFRRTADGEERARGTLALPPLTVVSVLEDGERAPAELAPPVAIEVPRERVALAWLVLAVALVALAWALRRFVRGRRGTAPAAPPPVPADVAALAALSRLEHAPVGDAPALRSFHIELAEVVKRYLEARFRFPAPERTTSEVDLELRRIGLGRTIVTPVRELLDACDAVKFAGDHPHEERCRRRVADARSLVERTRADLDPEGAHAP